MPLTRSTLTLSRGLDFTRSLNPDAESTATANNEACTSAASLPLHATRRRLTFSARQAIALRNRVRGVERLDLYRLQSDSDGFVCESEMVSEVRVAGDRRQVFAVWDEKL